MPFTPFHFGIGYAASALERKPRFFCFYTFVIVQVIIDVETLVNMLIGAIRLHTFFHTFLGSLVPMAISVLTVLVSYRPIRVVLSLLPKVIVAPLFSFRLFPENKPLLKTVIISSWFGAWTHVLLDAIMHSDTWPFDPFTKSNPFLEIISIGDLHLLLVSLIVFGTIVLSFRKVKQSERQ